MCISDGIGRVKEDLTLTVEFDGLGRFVDSICGFDERKVSDSFGLNSDVLFVHVLDVVDIVERLEGISSQSQGN